MTDDGTRDRLRARAGAAAEGSFHFIGVQVVSAEAFRQLPAGQPAQSIGGLYDALHRGASRLDSRVRLRRGVLGHRDAPTTGTSRIAASRARGAAASIRRARHDRSLGRCRVGAGAARRLHRDRRRDSTGRRGTRDLIRRADGSCTDDRDRVPSMLARQIDATCASGLRAITRRAAHRRRVRSPLLPRHLAGRAFDRPGAARGPIDFATLPFANVARLLQQVPLPVPAILGHSDALGILALQDLGDVTLQAHLGAASPAEHARAVSAGRVAHRAAAAARRRARVRPATCPTASRSTSRS